MSERGCSVAVEAVRAGYRLAGVGPRREVLRGIDFRLAPGTVTAVVGSNGAGKTTLLRALLGFLRPWSGRITVDAAPPARVRRRGGIAFLPDGIELPVGWTVRAFLREGERLAGAPPLRSTGPTLVDPSLEPWLGRRTSTLSRGITRRVALEFALAGAPRLAVLDEPFAGLDPPAREALAGTVRDLPHRGATVVLTSHDLGEVARVADEVLVLAGGRAVPAGPPGAVDRARLLALMTDPGDR